MYLNYVVFGTSAVKQQFHHMRNKIPQYISSKQLNCLRLQKLACVKDGLSTPCLRDMDSSSLHLLRGESTKRCPVGILALKVKVQCQM